MNGSWCYHNPPLLTENKTFNWNGKALRESKKNLLFHPAISNDEDDNLGLQLQQRSTSLSTLHAGGGSQQLLEPRMAQLETLEAKMASIEVSLSMTSRRKRGGSISIGAISPAAHQNKDHYKELGALKVALRDKENIIQTLQGQLYNTLSNRLTWRNSDPPLTEADKRITEERLQKLRHDTDNKRLTIKNLKFALERLNITDNIDVRIQQAELEYRLGREELELLSICEESRALQTSLEIVDVQEKHKNDTIFSCISDTTQVTIHAVEVNADPKSPCFGAETRDNTPGLYVNWAAEDSGLSKGDRIVEVNGKLVIGASRSDLERLLAVVPDAAQIVVLRKGESLTALRTLRSDNLRLTHRIGYLEEQIRDLLVPKRTKMLASVSLPQHEQVQVFQKGSQVKLVDNFSGLDGKASTDLGQSLSIIKDQHCLLSRPLTNSKNAHEMQSQSTYLTSSYRIAKNKQRQQELSLTRSTTSLDCKDIQTQPQLQCGRKLYTVSSAKHILKNRKSTSREQSVDFDSEPTRHCLQNCHLRASETSDTSEIYSTDETKSRLIPPKKPLRLTLHRAASLQSVESAPPIILQEVMKKPMKRNYKGDPPADKSSQVGVHRDTINYSWELQLGSSQAPSRTPSRAESYQSELR